MGCEYSLVRRRAREIHDLGKARLGTPDGLAPLDQRAMAPLFRGMSRSERRMVEAAGPGHAALWLIMGTPDRTVFRLSPTDRERVADLLHRGSDAVGTRELALLVADDVIAWADGDDLTLVVDQEVETLGQLGFESDIEHYRRAGGIHRTVARIQGDAR